MAASETQLRVRAKRAYELGRLRSKLPWAILPVLPAFCAMQGCPMPDLPLVQGMLLAAALVLFQWRGGSLARGAERGLFLGTPGFALPALCCAGGMCATSPTPILVALCFGGGLLAGLGVTLLALWRDLSQSSVVAGATVAGLTAAMGCSMAGSGGLLGLVLGLLLAVSPAFIWARAR